MATHFQAAPLTASPAYPNSVAWSDENLVAVASGHQITILNPAKLYGPRGLITLRPSAPFPIGVVAREDLLSGCLLSTCLSRDIQPCARSLSWSHVGLAPNSGCLLAVCTTEGRVKLYRSPFSEFCAEWSQVADISDLLLDHLACIDFAEVNVHSTKSSSISSHKEQAAEDLNGESGFSSNLQVSVSRRGRKRKLSRKLIDTETLEDELADENREDTIHDCTLLSEKQFTVYAEAVTFPCSSLKQDSPVEVFMQNGGRTVWVSGTIKHLDGEKALVHFPEAFTSGKQDKWVEINAKTNKLKEACLDGITPDQDAPSPKVRPSMDVGNLPEQVSLCKCHMVEDVLRIGQAVEAWIESRWMEGIFMGFDGRAILVKLSDVSDYVSVDAKFVRLAPCWNSKLKSWQITILKIGRRDFGSTEVVETINGKVGRYSQPCFPVPKNDGKSLKKRCFPLPKNGGKSLKKQMESGMPPLITARQYASRSAILSSTVVSWSPLLQLQCGSDSSNIKISSSNFSLLAVGGKSGKISFWRIHEPQWYSVEHSEVSVDVTFLGLLQAHDAWITAICWEKFGDSNSPILLATGSSDGSVKIWLGDSEELSSASNLNGASFSLLKEITSISPAPVSVLSSTIPVGLPGKMLLAIGRGSGSLEVWICDIPHGEIQCVGSCDAHYQIVTGLAWGFNGCSLYSCCQDNSISCWILNGSTLSKVMIPANLLGLWSSGDLPHVSDSCFGLTISPGNLVLAVARGFDTDLLNPMYQARTQKAAVEFFWIGGQQLDLSSSKSLDRLVEIVPGFSRSELAWWESNILWSLKQYEENSKHLVVWDVIAALSAFNNSAPTYVSHVLGRWLSSWFGDCDMGSSIEEILRHASGFLSKMHSRQLHLLNIICRRLVLLGYKTDIHDDQHDVFDDGQPNVWVNILRSSERELQERLVALNFAAVANQTASVTNALRGRYWLPIGVAQMEQWVAINSDTVQHQLKLLALEVKKLGKRLSSICEYAAEEKCRFCSAPVPFESPDVAMCEGVEHKGGVVQRHKLSRCAASMQICPSTPLWHCACCRRWVSNLAPQILFTMSGIPSGLKSLIKSSLNVSSTPMCPFCGILLQRLQPEFLLSASPV